MKLSSSTDRWHGKWMGLYLQLITKDAPCVNRVEVKYDPFNTIRKMSKTQLKDCGRMMAMYVNSDRASNAILSKLTYINNRLRIL